MSERSGRWTKSFNSHSPTDTEKLGHAIAKQLPAGALIVLTGDLGAGKTTFVKALAAELGIDPHSVISPTFVLVREHEGTHKLIHADAYRASSPYEFLEIGLEEYLDSDAIVVIEWGEKLDEILPDGAIRIQFQMLTGDERKITITAPAPMQL